MGSQNKRKHIFVHRAVSETFLLNPNNLLEVNHKDGIKINNLVTNLEWCNREYNMMHACKIGLLNPYGEYNSQSKLSNKQADNIRDIRKTGVSYRKIAKLYNVSHPTIIDIIKNKSYRK